MSTSISASCGSLKATQHVPGERRVSKFTYVEFYENAGKMNGADFLRNVVKAFPYKIHTVLTDNGMAFADLPKNRNGATRRYLGADIARSIDAIGRRQRRSLPHSEETRALMRKRGGSRQVDGVRQRSELLHLGTAHRSHTIQRAPTIAAAFIPIAKTRDSSCQETIGTSSRAKRHAFHAAGSIRT